MKHNRTITPKATRFFAKRSIIENIPDAKAFAELKSQKKRDDDRFLRELRECVVDATLFRWIKSAIYKDFAPHGDYRLSAMRLQFIRPEFNLAAIIEQIARENGERAKRGGKQ